MRCIAKSYRHNWKSTKNVLRSFQCIYFFFSVIKDFVMHWESKSGRRMISLRIVINGWNFILSFGKLETQWIGKMTTNQSVIALLFHTAEKWWSWLELKPKYHEVFAPSALPYCLPWVLDPPHYISLDLCS